MNLHGEFTTEGRMKRKVAFQVGKKRCTSSTIEKAMQLTMIPMARG